MGEVPAFPAEHGSLDSFPRGYHFTRKYLEALENMLKGLGATSLPTDEEKSVEIKKANARLIDKGLTTGGENTERKFPAAPTPRGMIPDGGGMPPGLIAGGRPMGRGGRGVTVTRAGSTDDATLEGTRIATENKARQGPIYASVQNSLRPVLSEGVPANEAALWTAQVHLWVTGEILAAIGETIEESLKGPVGRGKKAWVAKSGIKRLVELDVDDQYAIGGAKTVAKSSSRKIKRPTGALGMGGMDMGGMVGGGPRAPRGGADSESFTRRICDKRRDVVHYSFTVIMDPKYLPALQRNLMRQNYHTILDQPSMVQEVPDETSGYSYGHDPIMRVTIRGELLLLTDWERGTWLAKEKKWSQQLPPLMPKDVLVRLKASGALRPEDQKRLTGEAGAGSKRTRSSRR